MTRHQISAIFLSMAFFLSPEVAIGGAAPADKARSASSGVSLAPKWVKGREVRYRLTQDSRRSTASRDVPEMNSSDSASQVIELAMRVLDDPPTPVSPASPGSSPSPEKNDPGTTDPQEPEKSPEKKPTQPSSKAGSKAPETVRVEVLIESAQAEMESGDGKASVKRSIHQPGKPSRSSPKKSKPSGSPGAGEDDEGVRERLERWADAAVGSRIVFTVDQSGKILDVQGGEGLAGQSTATDPSALISPVETMKWLVQGLNQASSTQPELVRAGDSWTNNDTLSNTPIGAFAMSTTHRVRSVSRSQAKVSFTGAITSDKPEGSLLGSIAQIKNASYSGEYTWDAEFGQLASLSADLAVELLVGSPGPDSSGAISSRASSTVKYERLPSKP